MHTHIDRYPYLIYEFIVFINELLASRPQQRPVPSWSDSGIFIWLTIFARSSLVLLLNIKIAGPVKGQPESGVCGFIVALFMVVRGKRHCEQYFLQHSTGSEFTTLFKVNCSDTAVALLSASLSRLNCSNFLRQSRILNLQTREKFETTGFTYV